MKDLVLWTFAIFGFVASCLAIYQFVWPKLLKRPTWRSAFKAAGKVLDEVAQEFPPKVVVGLGRSGAMWAGWLAGNLGSVPVKAIDRVLTNTDAGVEVSYPDALETLKSIRERFGDNARVLFVMGGSSRGLSTRQFLNKYRSALADCDYAIAVLFKSDVSEVPARFYGKVLSPWPDKLPWHQDPRYRPFHREHLPNRARLGKTDD